MLTRTTRRERGLAGSFESFSEEELCARQGPVIARTTTAIIHSVIHQFVAVSLAGFIAALVHTH